MGCWALHAYFDKLSQLSVERKQAPTLWKTNESNKQSPTIDTHLVTLFLCELFFQSTVSDMASFINFYLVFEEQKLVTNYA